MGLSKSFTSVRIELQRIFLRFMVLNCSIESDNHNVAIEKFHKRSNRVTKKFFALHGLKL